MDGPVTQGHRGPALEDLVLGQHGNAAHTSSNSERPTRRATHVSLVGHRPHDGPSADIMMPAGVDTQPDRLVISLRDQLQRRLHGTRSAVGACCSSRLDPLTRPIELTSYFFQRNAISIPRPAAINTDCNGLSRM